MCFFFYDLCDFLFFFFFLFFFSFFAFLLWPECLALCWIRAMRAAIFGFLLILGRKHQVFMTTCNVSCKVLFVDALYQIKCPFILIFLRISIVNGYWIFSNAFLFLLLSLLIFLKFSKMVERLHWFQILKQVTFPE